MKRTSLVGQASGLAIITLVAALAAGCQKNAPAAPANVNLAPAPVATLPLSDLPASSLTPAPSLAALPLHPLRRLRVARPIENYAFAERAYQVAHGFGDAPPDYTFDYQGVRPWTWQGDNGYQTVVEPLPNGGDRYYYYQPGSDAPFYVRDPDFGYGYQDGALVVVYGRDGRPLPPQYQDQHADDAGRYLWRAQALYQASRRARHSSVARANWEARRTQIARDRTQWSDARYSNPDWRTYQSEHGQQDQANWARERYRREAEAARVDQASHNEAQAARERQAAIAASGLAVGGGAAGAAWLSTHHGAHGGAAPIDQQQAFAARQAQAQSTAQLAAARQAQTEAQARSQALATQQAQLAARQAALHAQAEAATSAAAASQAAAKSRVLARQQAANQAIARQAQEVARQQQATRVQALRQAQVERQAQSAQQAAARQAEAQARQLPAQAQMQAARQAQAGQQAAARQAEAQARQQQAQARAQVDRQAQASQQAAARQAEAKARQQQVQARIQAARQAQAARAKAARETQGKAKAPEPSTNPTP